MIAVLAIGGMDSSGGAGLLRDAATLADGGVMARVAVTAVTAQRADAVPAIQPVPPAIVAAQIAAAGPVGAVKIGMLANAGIVAAVAGALPPVPVVLDPVLAASAGPALIDAEGVARMLAELLPRATLLTPNRPELAALARALDATAEGAVAALLARGCRAVLVKGGHDDDPAASTDCLYRPGQPPLTFAAPRIAGTLRGTGCQLASAIAARLALGDNLPAAIAAAKAQVQRRFAASPPRPGAADRCP